jgi:hypothetical protein
MESFYVQILDFYGLELFPKLLSGILFSLLQASICTEWEQNSPAAWQRQPAGRHTSGGGRGETSGLNFNGSVKCIFATHIQEIGN